MQRFDIPGLLAATALVAGVLMAPHACPAADQSPPPAAAAAPHSDSILLTIFLRHDQNKTVDEINEHLKQTGWYDKFPPK
ncbi:MAG: hypothetical protein J2P48_22905, partial [Alphaproteobacteria bacterium]|nr:hypothetical protein [Alphaproteobacteria bacterium]